MLPKRSLLYHRGVDDHVGTYVTDYVLSGVLLILCVQLTSRICRHWKKMAKEQCVTLVYQSYWAPWNWTGNESTPITMTSYALLMFGYSNMIVTLFGGLTHQFVQTIENYSDVSDVWAWLVVWRIGAAFSAFVCLSLCTLGEQFMTQEGCLRISRPFRIGYYVIMLFVWFGFFIFNFVPLTGDDEDPFSIANTFIVVFVVMFFYAISVTFVILRKICCCTRRQELTESLEQQNSGNYVTNEISENHNYRNELYECCKKIVVRCQDSDDATMTSSLLDLRSRRWELCFTLISPWIFLSAGIMNYFLKKKCADSDSAHLELGCPLPDEFNHNAAMHVIQAISMIGLFVAENLAITRRSRSSSRTATFKRVATTTTMVQDNSVFDDVTSCDDNLQRGLKTLAFENEISNNNKPSHRDDVIFEMKSSEAEALAMASEKDTIDGKTEPIPHFPKFPVFDVRKEEYRESVYDNVTNSDPYAV